MTYTPPMFAPTWADYLRADGSYDLNAAYTDLFGESWHAQQYFKLVESIMPLRTTGAATLALANAHVIYHAKA